MDFRLPVSFSYVLSNVTDGSRRDPFEPKGKYLKQLIFLDKDLFEFFGEKFFVDDDFKFDEHFILSFRSLYKKDNILHFMANHYTKEKHDLYSQIIKEIDFPFSILSPNEDLKSPLACVLESCHVSLLELFLGIPVIANDGFTVFRDQSAFEYAIDKKCPYEMLWLLFEKGFRLTHRAFEKSNALEFKDYFQALFHWLIENQEKSFYFAAEISSFLPMSSASI